ncbi:MAG: endonuclease MutS2, partial [Bryobacteraceae bacterium]
MLGRYVSSPQGRSRLDAVAPHCDRARLEEDLAECGEAIDYLRSAAAPKPAARGAAVRLDFAALPDLTQAVHKIRIEGASLDPPELTGVLALLDRAADVKAVLGSVGGRFPRLGRRGAQIAEFRPLLRDLAGKIEPDGTVSSRASVALGRVRRDIERQRRAVQESLERFLRAHREEGLLQEEIVTIRNERFVVPVIAGQRRRIQGVIHGASSTGHTLFVEPLETIELNNDLVRLAEEELREVHRILREMTERLREYGGAIAVAADTLGALDLVFGKARFAVEFDCVVPRFSPDGAPRLDLREARHPLLEDVLRRQRKRVVGCTITLEGGGRTLLISGPNTGGKTVALKTAGLVSLMAQAAIPVPCASAELPVFEQVLADIGDNQSIQASLSTFSAHVSRLREMALDATSGSLVLLDEIGAATDPEEGGALGVAVVDQFRAAGAFTLASTHLLPLKVYGATTPGVVNASMGFDEETLQPSYEMRTGLPGKSAGLD